MRNFIKQVFGVRGDSDPIREQIEQARDRNEVAANALEGTIRELLERQSRRDFGAHRG